MCASALKEITALLEALPEDIRREAERQYAVKRVEERMLPFFQAVAELANLYQLIPPSTDPEARYAAFRRLVNHVQRLWEDAAQLFASGSYSSALFLGIVAIEELGKVAVAKVQAVLGVPGLSAIPGVGGGRAPLRSHARKHLLAASAGAVINSRLDRLIGVERVLGFLERTENGTLERQRQDCLYYDIRDGQQYLPSEVIAKEEAELVLVIAGELLAEVGSITAEELGGLLAKVTAFETEHTSVGSDSE